ncbi:MAG TPA: hypothetical protein VNJ29_01005 [Candidatus Nitrosotenuis sp.]|nr:hypothetical protein [Candidatus Nitrosotenuis sp.]
MFNSVIIKQTFRENILQPTFIFVLIIELFLVTVVILGLKLHYENNILVSVDLFGGSHEENVYTFIETLLFMFFDITNAPLMFLFILLASFTQAGLLNDPLLGITLTKPVSRTQLFLSKFCGLTLLVASNIILFSLIMWLILSIKRGEHLNMVTLVGAISFSYEFVVMLAIVSLLTLLLENPSAVTVITAAIYFYLGPLIASSANMENIFLKFVTWVVPPVGELHIATRNTVLMHQLTGSPYYLSIVYLVVLLFVSVFLFNRKEIK